jgi:hypothetical protein
MGLAFFVNLANIWEGLAYMQALSELTACSFGWWLMAGAGLF